MDEIKGRLLDFITKQGHPKIPIIGSDIDDINIDEDCDVKESSSKPSQPERPSDQEILETIDDAFFNTNDGFDACRYELEKHEVLSDIKKIEQKLQQLKQQHFVVSNHVLQMILEKQSACDEELKRIGKIHEELGALLKEVKFGRDNLGVATTNFTTASLAILANYRKRTLVNQLLRSLNTIRTLHKTECRMPVLLGSGDFFGAISLLLECQEVASMYRHFSCVAGLSGKLQDTLEMTEEHLDVALAKICYGFDEEIYKKLQSAYLLLGKTQIAIDQLHMHFTSAVHNTAFNVIHFFISHKDYTNQIQFSTICKVSLDHNDFSNKVDFSELCKSIQEENFIPCLLALCKSLWCIILSYYQVVAWHQNNSLLNDAGSESKTCFTEASLLQKLNSGLSRLWHDIQTRVSSLVLAANLTNYKFDDFLQILAILHRLSQIGEELCGSDSEEVASSVKTQSSNYFKKYHAAKLDDLRVFLENESWTPCPVRSDFTILHLQEFRGLRCTIEQCAGGVYTRNNTSLDSSSVDANFFVRYPDPNNGTPFDISFATDSRNEEILAKIPDDPSGYYSEESEEDESNATSSEVDKERECSKKGGVEGGAGAPLLTNTTLTVLRLSAKYLQMSRYLRPIASEVVAALTHLYHFYLYTVHSFFTSDLVNNLGLNISTLKLQAVLNRIRDNLIVDIETDTGQEEMDDLDPKVYEAGISPIVNLNSEEELYGLKERLVGVESLLFLSRTFTYLRSYLEHLLHSQGATTHLLNQFYNQSVAVSYDLRKPVYACVAWRSIGDRQAITLMSRVNWEVKDVMSQHSKYVDCLIYDLQAFTDRLKRVNDVLAIPEEAFNILWDCFIYLLANIFVEGYSNSKKCSNGGRALMQLDFIQLVSKLEKVCPLRPIPYKDFVEGYIKAFYLPEETLETWIKEHTEYSAKQLLALVSCACQNNKKSRIRLCTLIEELEKSGVR